MREQFELSHKTARRSFLADGGRGLLGIALAAMLHRDGYSHMESFDPKPMLNKYAGKSISETPFADVQKNLSSRGLLDETLVVFATEFGRTPGTQGAADGRDHHIFGFSVWLAGVGIKGGVVHGATDEIGFHAVEDRHYVTDIHAKILKQLGLDSRKLEVPGRKRLDIDHGKPIDQIIA